MALKDGVGQSAKGTLCFAQTASLHFDPKIDCIWTIINLKFRVAPSGAISLQVHDGNKIKLQEQHVSPLTGLNLFFRAIGYKYFAPIGASRTK
jgi:hypothetical protein